MKALVYGGPGEKSWKDVPDPKIQKPTDVIVKMDTTTICGTDLHILKGDVPAVTPGRILGHEGVGTITEVGSAVTELKVGRPRHHLLHQVLRALRQLQDRALLALPGRGRGLRDRLDLRAPDRRHPGRVRSRALCGDLPAHAARRASATSRPSCSPTSCPPATRSACSTARSSPATWSPSIGAGPVGLAAIATAGLYGAATIIAIDLDANRLEQASEFGATDGVLSSDAGLEGAGPRADRRARRRRRHRGGRHPGDLHDVHRHRPARRHMSPTSACTASRWSCTGGSLDPEHHHQHGPGQHQHHPDAAQAGRPEKIAGRELRHPPLRASTTFWTPTTSSAAPRKRRRSR